MAIVLGQFARARGQNLEATLWDDWDGPPTTRWLRPWDATCSDQQKAKWRGALKRLTGITIPATLQVGVEKIEVDRIIADATRQLRYALRGRPDAAMITTHNEDYGFARNLCALRWYWVGLSLLSAVACVVAIVAGGVNAYAGLVVASVFLVVTLLIARELPNHVKRCAERYAESLFASAILVSKAADDSRASADPASKQ